MPNETLYFPPYQLIPGVNLLLRDGEVVSLEPRAVQVLSYLVRHRDRLVPKGELLDKVWADVFTTDAVVKQAVSQVRRALGDAPDSPRYIQTFHSRGYQFIAPVSVDTAGQEPGDREAGGPANSAGARTGPVEDEVSRASVGDVGAIARTSRRVQAGPNYDLFVGREKELSLLQAEYARVLSGSGQPIVVKGEPGIGKTQLARNFGQWASAEGASFIYARFFDYEGGRLAPYEALIDLLSAALAPDRRGEAGGARAHSTRVLRETIESRCGEHLPDELFGGEEANATVVRVGAGDHFRIVVPLGRAFLSLSRERPLVMVLDDLQWADEVSLDCLGYLMRARASESLMLVLLARAEEASDAHHKLAQWLKRQVSYRSFTSVVLSPLGESSCREAVEEAFGGAAHAPHIPHADTRTMFRVTGGNPYFLVETLRLLVAEGAISDVGSAAGSESRWQWNGIEHVPLPDTLVMAALGKLERLPEELRGLLEHAAVIGDEFRLDTLARMSSRGEDLLDKSLREGIQLGVLAERGVSIGEDYRFYHTILRRVLYESIAPRRRRSLHRSAAAAIEEVYARHPDRVAEALSAHYEEAGDAASAFRWAMRAGAAASARWHWNEAVSCAERARRAAERLHFDDGDASSSSSATANARVESSRRESPTIPASEKLSMLLALCESLHAVGRNKELEPVLPEALSLARALRDERAEAAVLIQTGLVHTALSQYREALSAVEQALEIYRHLGDGERARMAVVQLGRVRASMGDYEVAGQLIEAVLEEPSVAEETAADAAGVLGWARVLQGRYTEGVGLMQRALDHHARCGNLRLRAQLLRRLHWADLSRGHNESAVALALGAQKDFQAIGDLFGEAKTYMGVGQARIAQGLYDEGIGYLRRTLESLKTNGDAHCEAETLWLMGRAHCEAGNLAEADSLLARALEMIRHIGDRDDEFRILVDQARAALARDDYAAALAKSSDAAMIASELSCRDGVGFALAEQSNAHRGLGQTRRAVTSAEEAVWLLEETGSGERWRGYWALAQALDARESREDAQVALMHAVELLDEMRAQFGPGDELRHKEMTRARSLPAQLLYQKLLQSNRHREALALKLSWALDVDAAAAPTVTDRIA
jgi:DNA-binding winged helix-turn-helix (wHTH) protein/tetratricopeptide (TPR) repeat protein